VLQTILGPLLIATRGWASPEVEAAYERAHELARRSADPARALPPIFYGLGSLYESRGEYRRAAEVLQQVLDLEDTGHAAHHMGSHELLACSLFHQGKFDRATTHAETGWELYDPDQHLELQARYGYNPGVGCLTWGALSLWYLGETERASALMADAFALAQDADHAYSLASAHEQAAILHQLRDEPTVTLDHAAAALEMARAAGFTHHVAIAQILWGWSRAAMGGTAEGLDELRAGIEAYRATGARMDLPYFLGLLADALLRAGRIDEGMAAIDEALAESGDRDYCHAAELHRLRALLLAQRGAADEDVAAELVRARDIARRQGAPVLEERASLALDEIAPAVASTESAG
jgi:predicted ATPase